MADDVDLNNLYGNTDSDPTQVVKDDDPKLKKDPQKPVIAAGTDGSGEQYLQEAENLVRAGDREGARRVIAEGVKAYPDNQDLRDVQQILKPASRTRMDEKTLMSRAKPLMQFKPAEDAAEGPIEASVVAWPAAAGAQRAAQAGRLPPGAATPPGQALRMTPAEAGPERAALKEALNRLGMGDYSGADKALTAHLAKKPEEVVAWRGRALARRFQGKPVEALKDAKKAVSLGPSDLESVKVKAMILRDLQRFAEAVQLMDGAIELSTEDPTLYAERGKALQGLGRMEEAIADFQQAAELDGRFAKLYEEALLTEPPAARSRRWVKRSKRWLPWAGLSLLALAGGLFLTRRHLSTRRAVLAAPEESEPLPQGYKVVRLIGQGGMGLVYEARDLALERPVALKRLRPEIAAEPRERRHFIKEARTVAALKHPHIVEIYTVVEDGNDLFLVFEYLQGQSLADVLGTRQRLSPADAVAILGQAAQAVDYAHAQGVIHQDLKPSNIVLAGDRAKVMDFGIARRAMDILSTVSRNQVAGTPAYMAPEQALGRPLPASDLFAMGVCAYELLSGTRPFPDALGGLARLESGRPSLAQAAGLPAGVDAVMEKALAADPAARFPSAASLVSALQSSLALG